MTQTGNAIRAHMAEFGIVAAKGESGFEALTSRVGMLPQAARLPVEVLFDQLAGTRA